jgi:hypothetical protein
MWGAMPDEQDQIERVHSRLSNRDKNLRMWGQLYVSQTGRTVGGWLVDSWSEGGAPYWQPEMHWLDKKDGKAYRVQLNINMGRSAMNLYGEDKEIDPGRAKFIRATVAQWEQEWLEDEGKKMGG